MGIKSINKLLEKHVPNYESTISLKLLSGYRMAIDSNLLLHSVIRKSYGDVIDSMHNPLDPIDEELVFKYLLASILEFIINMTSHQILLVWVWDGTAPPEKFRCREKRQLVKDKIKERILTLKEKLLSMPQICWEMKDIDAYKSVLKQDSIINYSIITKIRSAIELMGFPSVQSIGEGEKMCASLAREGLVYGVWSTDTDNYALGTPVLINGFLGSSRTFVKIVVLDYILEVLQKNHKWLIDLCIMCGCDFNENISRVGTVGSWNLMQKYNSIENIIAFNPTLDATKLIPNRCREIFSYDISGYDNDSPELKFNQELFYQWAHLLLDQYGLSHYFDQLSSSLIYINFIPQNIEKKASLNVIE